MSIKTRVVYGDYRPLRKGEAGYSPTKRLYVDPNTGDIIPRRQVLTHGTRQDVEVPSKIEKREAKELIGVGSREDSHRISRLTREVREEVGFTTHQRKYQEYVDEYAKVVNKRLKEQGLNDFTRGQIIRSSEFKQFYQDLKSKDNKAHGRKARALEFLGWREEDADWDVGETP